MPMHADIFRLVHKSNLSEDEHFAAKQLCKMMEYCCVTFEAVGESEKEPWELMIDCFEILDIHTAIDRVFWRLKEKRDRNNVVMKNSCYFESEYAAKGAVECFRFRWQPVGKQIYYPHYRPDTPDPKHEDEDEDEYEEREEPDDYNGGDNCDGWYDPDTIAHDDDVVSLEDYKKAMERDPFVMPKFMN
jgi:hypothetical protein